MTLQKLKDLRDLAFGGITAGLIFGAAYTGLTIAVNIALLPFEAAWNGLERAVGEVKTENLTLEESKKVWSHDTEIYMGTFSNTNGVKRKLIDSYDIPAGKFFANSQLRKAVTGKTYRVTSLEGPLSCKILAMNEINLSKLEKE